MEIDFLITGKDKVLPIEVKLSANVAPADARSIQSFMADHKKNVPLGIIVYSGKNIVEIRENIWGVLDWLLFGGF